MRAGASLGSCTSDQGGSEVGLVSGWVAGLDVSCILYLISREDGYTSPVNHLLSPPLARWDGLHLVFDLATVARQVNQYLAVRDDLRDLSLAGAGDALAAELTIVWKGVPARVGLEIGEIRLRLRHLGFRMRRLRALGGLPVPRSAVEFALRAFDSPYLSVFPGQGIVVIDLRRWLPEELALQVLTVQGTARSLHLWFGPGSLVSLPGKGPRLLPADTD